MKLARIKWNYNRSLSQSTYKVKIQDKDAMEKLSTKNSQRTIRVIKTRLTQKRSLKNCRKLLIRGKRRALKPTRQALKDRASSRKITSIPTSSTLCLLAALQRKRHQTRQMISSASWIRGLTQRAKKIRLTQHLRLQTICRQAKTRERKTSLQCYQVRKRTTRDNQNKRPRI